jgi:hypothetical protein
MAVFDGSCGQFVELTCDDDSGIGATSYIDAFTFHAGRTYFVEIMEYGPNGGIGFDAGDKGPNTPASGMLHFTLNARQALAVKLADLTTTAPILSLALLVAVALGLLLLTFVAVKRQEMRDRLRKIRATRRRRQFDD